MTEVKSVYFAASKGSWCVVVDLLREIESCHGHRLYTLDNSSAAQRIVIPISKLILPGPNALELNNYYGYLEFINYEKKDYLIQNGKQIDIENYKIKRDVLVRIDS